MILWLVPTEIPDLRAEYTAIRQSLQERPSINRRFLGKLLFSMPVHGSRLF
jgi:hypothetical protein